MGARSSGLDSGSRYQGLCVLLYVPVVIVVVVVVVVVVFLCKILNSHSVPTSYNSRNGH